MVKGSVRSSQSRPGVLDLIFNVGCSVWQRYKAFEYSARWYRVKVYALVSLFRLIRAFFA